VMGGWWRKKTKSPGTFRRKGKSRGENTHNGKKRDRGSAKKRGEMVEGDVVEKYFFPGREK